MRNNLYTIKILVKRHFKVFLSDKMAVFFSLLAPLIIIMLYWLFLGNVQLEGIISIIDADLEYDVSLIEQFLDQWMIAGVLAVACFTVSFGANSVMIKDKDDDIIKDFMASPVPPSVISASYYIYNFFVTCFIVFITFACSLVYYVVNHNELIPASTLGFISVVIIVANFLGTTITVLIVSFLKSEAQFGAVTGILSALYGFLIGAYLPLNLFPSVIRTIIAFLPTTYIGALLRNLLMSEGIKAIGSDVSEAFSTNLAANYALDYAPFGFVFNNIAMLAVIFVSGCLFLVLGFVIQKRRAPK